MTATLQLAFALDARRDDLAPAEVAAVEAAVEDQDRRRSSRATYAPRCRCRAGWTDDGETCAKCGRRLA